MIQTDTCLSPSSAVTLKLEMWTLSFMVEPGWVEKREEVMPRGDAGAKIKQCICLLSTAGSSSLLWSTSRGESAVKYRHTWVFLFNCSMKWNLLKKSFPWWILVNICFVIPFRSAQVLRQRLKRWSTTCRPWTVLHWATFSFRSYEKCRHLS